MFDIKSLHVKDNFCITYFIHFILRYTQQYIHIFKAVEKSLRWDSLYSVLLILLFKPVILGIYFSL